jgi:hypothetical protein
MTEFKTDDIFEALKAPLGMIDDPQRRQQIENYIEAVRANLERAVFDLLSEFADAVNDGVSAHYDVSLSYKPGVLDLSVRAREAGEPDMEEFSMADGDVEKITIRVPAELKEMAAEAAKNASLSANSWFVRQLARSVRGADIDVRVESREKRHRGRRKGPGGKLSGWVGPESED